MSVDPDPRAVASLCQQTLEANWTEGTRLSDGVRYAYTRPSPGHYPWQWFWDSCFTAIVWRRFDPARSRRELESLLAAQREDGFIGHTIFWGGPPRDVRRFTYNICSPTDTMTSSIQPPALAWAWRIAVGDPAEAPGITRLHDWLQDNRDLEGDGLIWIVQPDESGLDASTQFDVLWGRRAHSRMGFPLLVRRNRSLGYDLRKIAAAGGPVCCEVMTNVLYGLSRLALGQTSLTPAIIDRFYDEASGLFWLDARPSPARRPSLTWTALAPLALPDLPESIGQRLVEEHLLNPQRFWLPVPPPSVAADDPGFSLRDSIVPRVRRYWRGPTWVNSAWLVWLGLVRLGYAKESQELARRLGRTVLARGLREYYHPYSGEGMGTSNFAWSTLVTELVEPDPRAADSYLSAQAPAER
jgi:hypothetical protein